ncbi:MAG TPA: carboxylating nicotinate-nucleotide diphosphorylase [Cryomorphaceae bacterium]|nr:carboxylating nicotinate-nucleotide diphosphorylase [Cryomorphaceae bacterium]
MNDKSKNILKDMTIDEFIRNAVQEDVGEGDHTSLACVPEDAVGRAHALVKEDGVIAGLAIAEQIFYFIDPSLQVESLAKDGDDVTPGTVVMQVSGSVRSILQGERLVLNVMQRMSGIAGTTRRIVRRLEGLDTKVLDTRKTTPGMRFLEKMAVKIGGGENHRFGLFDMMMLKDNHIDFAGGIRPAIERANAYRTSHALEIPLEIEARNLEELDEILEVGGVDRVMLDNFGFGDLREAVRRVDGRVETEASGNITEATARQYAECGVDFISMGALTHSVKSLDISLKAY